MTRFITISHEDERTQSDAVGDFCDAKFTGRSLKSNWNGWVITTMQLQSDEIVESGYVWVRVHDKR